MADRYPCELHTAQLPDELLELLDQIASEIDGLDESLVTAGRAFYAVAYESVTHAFLEVVKPLTDALGERGCSWLHTTDAKWDLGGWWVDDLGHEGLWLQGVGPVTRLTLDGRWDTSAPIPTIYQQGA